ncbi:MAG: hypothetical protein QOH21_2567 [Acidobacteriota bacterium]|jgi:outer membrane receptor for ferrienterochelin and colicin|nr:hypothetical protein [Acidobacteriota bacterium]
MQKLFRCASVLVAVLALLLPLTAVAQTSRTTGAITGTVTDTSGSALPGVTVNVSSPNLQGTRTEVTDANGSYSIPALPPGRYRVEFTLSGVQSQVREGVNVNAQQSTGLAVQMSLSVSETVTVTASQIVVDPTQATTQHTVDEDRLKYGQVGSANRSYQNALTQAPGVVATAGGNPQVSGANLANNDYFVDGVNTTDPVTHTFGGNMAFDAIQEISVVTFGKDAEYKASGGTVNVITKSGGNEFSGSLDVRYNDPDFLEAGHEKRTATPAFFGGPPGASSLRYDKSVQTAKSEQPQATFGGPILRDKLWFFVATHKPKTVQQAPNLNGFQPGARTFEGWNTHAKLTLTPWANQTFTAKYTDSNATISNSQFSSLVPTEADSQQEQASWIYALAYDAVLTSKWLGNLQYSHRPGELITGPMSGDLTTVGVINNANNIRSVNYTNYQGRTSERDELIASTTYYLERFGTHAFKAGLGFDHNEFTSFNQGTGDPSTIPGFNAANFCSPAFGFPTGTQCSALIRTNVSATIPQRVVLSSISPESTVGADTTSFYVQDEWRPIPRLTARLGVRYDTTSWDNNGGNAVPDFELLQPRVGLAYDIFNNASSVIHAFGGKIGDENQLTLPSFGVKQFSATRNFDLVNGVYVRNPVGESTSLSGTPIDPSLSASFSNQYSAGFTQRIFGNSSIDVTAEYKSTKNLFEDYCGTIDGPGVLDECFVTNFAGPAGTPNPLRGDYRAVITKLESRPFSWLDFTLSHTRSKSRGSTDSTQNAAADFDYYPVHFTNTFGYLSDDARDRVKFNGYARLPFQTTLGASYNWNSGAAYSITRTAPLVGYGNQFLEPRGSRRLPHFNQLDLQLQKDFSFGQYRFGLIGSVINALNSETITGINGNAGTRAISDPNDPTRVFVDPNQQTGTNRFAATFLQPSSFQLPRRYEVGVRFEF